MSKRLLVAIVFFTALGFSQDKVQEVNQLIDNYANTLHSNADSALIYITRATEESTKLKDDYLVSRCLYNLGNFYYLENDFQKSKTYTNKAIRYAKKKQPITK